MFDVNNKLFKIIDFGEKEWKQHIEKDITILFKGKSGYVSPEIS